MADLGHDVLAVDVDARKVAEAAKGTAPFFEPGLEPLLRKNLERNKLRFSTSYEEAARFADVHFICVGTPQAADGSADLSYLYAAIGTLAPYLTKSCLVVGKSTVPVGTARRLAAYLTEHAPAGNEVELAWNPEFLREGFAVQDSLTPDRLVFGVESDRAADLLRQIYSTALRAGIPGLVMDFETAELVKVSANAFLATKISFINAVAQVCENSGGDVIQLAEALRLDERIGRRYLAPGLGFGGGCLPKDIQAFQITAADFGATALSSLLESVGRINELRRTRAIDLARDVLGGSLVGRRVAALGVSFKPDSDDIRDSPSLDVCGRLLREGAIVTAHDPIATPPEAMINEGLRFDRSVHATIQDVDLILHLTEWEEYRAIDPVTVSNVVAQRVMIDARGVLDAQLWRSAGWSFHVLGQGASRSGSAQGVGHHASSSRLAMGLVSPGGIICSHTHRVGALSE
jgi:UDPglucose 6-dehydrogenase